MGVGKKFICITTDNGSNMVAASKLLPNTFRIPCAAHTLNLVVNKGLMPVEILIARAKRLINFFMSPKQNERLKAIQIHQLNGTEVLYFYFMFNIFININIKYIFFNLGFFKKSQVLAHNPRCKNKMELVISCMGASSQTS